MVGLAHCHTPTVPQNWSDTFKTGVAPLTMHASKLRLKRPGRLLWRSAVYDMGIKGCVWALPPDRVSTSAPPPTHLSG